MSRFRLGEKLIIVAEMANSHDGDPEQAARIIQAAARAGADAVKFQIFDPAEFLVPEHPQFDYCSQLKFSAETWRSLAEQVRSLQLGLVVEPEGSSSAEIALGLDPDLVKVHPSHLCHQSLLRSLAASGKPLLIGTGGATFPEISSALTTVLTGGCKEVCLLAGIQSFPTKLDDTAVRWVSYLRSQYGVPVGFADHVVGDSPMAFMVPAVAVGAGATLIEKHIALERVEGNSDTWPALNPGEFGDLVSRLREVERAMGEGRPRLGEADFEYRRFTRTCVVAARHLGPGATLAPADLDFKRPEEPRESANYDAILGKELVKPIARGEPVTGLHIKQKVAICVAARTFSKRLPKKVLEDVVNGKTALGVLLHRLKRSREADVVILCTSTHPGDDPLPPIAGEEGAMCYRGSELDVLRRFIDAGEMVGADIIVRITADNILTDPDYVDRAIRMLRGENLDYVKVKGVPDDIGGEVFTLRVMKMVHEAASDTSKTEFMAWYFDDPTFVRQGQLWADPEHHRPNYRLTLDYPEDLEIFRAIYAAYPEMDCWATEIVQYIDTHPELVSLMDRVRDKTTDTPEFREALGIELRVPAVDVRLGREGR